MVNSEVISLKPFWRWIIVVLVVLYVGWLVFPVLKGLAFPDYGPDVPSMGLDDVAPEAGHALPAMYDDAPVISDSIQGQTALTAMISGNIPVVGLWALVVSLYAVSAFLHAGGNLRTAFVYISAFLGDLVLTFVTKGQAGAGVFEKIVEALSGWDPRYVITLAALVLGILILLGRRAPVMKLGYEQHDKSPLDFT